MNYDTDVDDYQDVEPAEVPTRQENGAITAIRHAQREAVARAKRAEGELRLVKAELQEQVLVNQKQDVLNVFRGAGVDVRFGEDAWTLGCHTVEEAAAWAIERGLLKDASQPELLQPERREGFVPAVGGSTASVDGTKTSWADFKRIATYDTEKAQRLLDTNMVVPPPGMKIEGGKVVGA